MSNIAGSAAPCKQQGFIFSHCTICCVALAALTLISSGLGSWGSWLTHSKLSYADASWGGPLLGHLALQGFFQRWKKNSISHKAITESKNLFWLTWGNKCNLPLELKRRLPPLEEKEWSITCQAQELGAACSFWKVHLTRGRFQALRCHWSKVTEWKS